MTIATAQLQVPSITMEDLQAFHAKHFPRRQHPPTPAFTLMEQNPEFDDGDGYDDDGDNDGLGYYPDGAKRTLTDEQIRIFRHSEIHALLRERQSREEASSQEEEEPASDKDVESRAGETLRNVAEARPSSTELVKVKPRQRNTDDCSVADRSRSGQDVESSHVAASDLDYGDEGSLTHNATNDAAAQSNIRFAGRRIISYED